MTFLLLRRKLHSWLLYGTIRYIYCNIRRSETGHWTQRKKKRCTSLEYTELPKAFFKNARYFGKGILYLRVSILNSLMLVCCCFVFNELFDVCKLLIFVFLAVTCFVKWLIQLKQTFVSRSILPLKSIIFYLTRCLFCFSACQLAKNFLLMLQ
jgi:hypothetical protein